MNEIPLWFLFLSLFLPRLTIWIAYCSDALPAHGFHSFWGGFFFTLFLPRILILIMIATCMGFCVWFWVHLLFAILAYGKTSFKVVDIKERK